MEGSDQIVSKPIKFVSKFRRMIDTYDAERVYKIDESSDFMYTNEELQSLAKELASRLASVESSVGHLKREKNSNERQIAMLRRNLTSQK